MRSNALPSAIIFDCDGTLVDSSRAYYLAFNAIVAQQNASMPEQWFASRRGLARHEIFLQFQDEFRIELDKHAMENGFLPVFQSYLGEVKEIKSITDIARSHFNRVPLAVASSGARDIVNATLSATGLLTLFTTVITIEDVKFIGKPAPDLFREAAHQLGVRAAECMVYEDSDEGIEAARLAGMSFRDVRLIPRDARYELKNRG